MIVQIKIKLLRVSKPPVWRQLQLHADTRLDYLHEIIQAAFGWENYHMHCFSSDGNGFGVPDPELGFIDGYPRSTKGIYAPTPRMASAARAAAAVRVASFVCVKFSFTRIAEPRARSAAPPGARARRRRARPR